MQSYGLRARAFGVFEKYNMKISSEVLRIKFKKKEIHRQEKFLSWFNLNKIIVYALNSGATKQNK